MVCSRVGKILIWFAVCFVGVGTGVISGCEDQIIFSTDGRDGWLAGDTDEVDTDAPEDISMEGNMNTQKPMSDSDASVDGQQERITKQCMNEITRCLSDEQCSKWIDCIQACGDDTTQCSRFCGIPYQPAGK